MINNVKYLLDFEFDDELSKYSGMTTILFDMITKEQTIQVDFGENLSLKKVQFNNETTDFIIKNSILYIKNPKYNNNSEEQQKLYIEYEGKFNEDKKGIFHKENIVYTQCEPTYARNIFPCFDDLRYRSIFQVTITCNERFTALTNSKIIKQEKITTNKIKTIFKESIPIPTYLFAICVGELDHFSTFTKDRKFPIEIYSIPTMKGYSLTLLDFLPKVVEWMETFTNIELAGDQLQFLITNNHTGMENYGLVMYGPNPSLQDLKKAKESTYRESLNVFCHEISHLWMGGITTFTKWEYLWIKEGFATFMSSYILNEIDPNSHQLEEYYRKEYLPILFSSIKNDDSIIYNTEYKVVQDLYNTISYSKSSVIFRMLLNWIGFDKFRESISLFLKSNYLKTSDYETFVSSFSKCLDFDISPFFETWTKQRNLPIITYEDYSITQEQFIEINDQKQNERNELKQNNWFIPLLIKRFNKTTKEQIKEEKFILATKTEKIDNPENDLLIINGNSSAFCLVYYKGTQFDELCELIKYNKLNNEESISIIVNTQILFENKIYNGKEASQILGCFSQYTSKQIINRCIDLINLLIQEENQSEIDNSSIFSFFQNNLKSIKEQISTDKLLLLIKALLPITDLDNLLNLLKDNKFGKNVIKKIRSAFSKK